MPEITSDFIKAFVATNSITFVATQPKLCVPIILRMCQKMSHGIKFDEIKVCDNLIIDGHHRYLSALIMKSKLGHVSSHSTSATKIIPWASVEFDNEDWDTAVKIAHLNKLDAEYNGLDLEFVNQITCG